MSRQGGARSQGWDALPQMLLIAFVTAFAGCAGDAPATGEPATASLVVVHEVLLDAPEDDPIGDVSDAVLWMDGVLIVDATQVNLKHFAVTGEHVHTIGRRGGGPGEFVLPAAVAVLDGERLAVLDKMLFRMSIFDRAGEVLATPSLGLMLSNHVTAMPSGDAVMIAGHTLAQRDDGAAHFRDAAHVVRLDGGVVESFAPQAASRRRGEGTFDEPRLALIDSVVIAGRRTSNVLEHLDLRTGRRSTAEALVPAYRPVDWEAMDGIPGYPMFSEAVVEWAREQMWLELLIPAGRDGYLAGFREERDGAPLYHYLLRSVHMAADVPLPPTPYRLFAVLDGDLYGTRMDGSGNVYLARLRVERRP